MANICEYRVIVKGKKNACYAFFGSMSCMDYKDIEWENGNNENFEMIFTGNCKWAVDAYCNNNYKGPIPVELPTDAEEALNEAEDKYWYNTVEYRSKMFNIEVLCNSADIEYDPENLESYYEHWKNGEAVYDDCPEELIIESVCWE